MKNELVSIIIPFYQSNINTLIKTIDSVVHQTYENIEISLCNDGNIDERQTLENVLKHFKAVNTIYSEHSVNRGISAARNTAVSVSNGKWLLWLDADDTLELDCIEQLMKFSTGVEMVLGNCRIYENDMVQLRQLENYIENCKIYFGTFKDPFTNHITSIQPELVSRNAFYKIGGFSEKFLYAEMTDFFLRFISYHGIDAIFHTPYAIYNYYRNSVSVSIEHRAELLKYRRAALLEYCERMGLQVEDIVYDRRISDGMQKYNIVF